MENSSKVVSYGKAVITPLSSTNWEISNFLDNNAFAKNGLRVSNHVVATIDSNTFTNSTSHIAFYPRNNHQPCDFIKIALWQLLAFSGLDLLTQQTLSKETNEDDGDLQNGPTAETTISATEEPKIVYQAYVNGRYRGRSDDFNDMTLDNQLRFINDNHYTIVSREDYNGQIAAYDRSLMEVTSTVGQNYVLLEYLRGKKDPSTTTAYRIWILQEVGSKGDINKTIANRIASIREKSKGRQRKKKDFTYDDVWRQISDNRSFGENVGSALYQNKNTFKNLNLVNNTVLHDRDNPVYPEKILSVGQWRQILSGIGPQGVTGQRVNHLPILYPNDADEKRFIYTNYFSSDLKYFQPLPEFRDSFVIATIRDLQEEYFMDKTRIDIYRSLVYPTIERNFSKQIRGKAANAIALPSLPTVLRDNVNFQTNMVINPSTSHSLDGQSYPNLNPNEYEGDAIQGKVYYPGSSNTFLYVRALAHEHLLPYYNSLVKDAKNMYELKNARIEGMRRALEYVRPIFDGIGNCNVGPGMQGVINTAKILRKENFNQIFVEMPNASSQMHFQDNFMTYVLSGAEHYLFLSTLHCDFYTLYMNSSCCYLLIRDKCHTCQDGDPGTGKTELFHVLKRCFPPGVCQEVSNESTMAHFFGTDKLWMIKIRNEPDPLRDGGANVRSNPIAMAKTEMEKTILSEQEGKKTISVFDKEKSKWIEKVIHVILSIVTVSNTNQGKNSRSNAVNDRAYNSHIAKKRRLNKGVSYMKSAQSSQNAMRKSETNTYIHNMWWISRNVGFISALHDIDCGLTDANFVIFDDMQEHLEKHFDLNVRSIERCRANARSQILHDAVNILLHHKPLHKQLNFYIDDELVDEKLSEKLGQLYTDDEQNTLKHEHHCTLYRLARNNKLSSFQEDDSVEVECVINLLDNIIHSKVYDEENEHAKPQLLKEPEKLKRKWEYLDLWDPLETYEVDDTVKVHVTGKESNFTSYFYEAKCVKTNVGEKPLFVKDSEFWEFNTTVVESLLGKYFQEPIQFDEERGLEFFMDVNRLNYCTVDVAVRNYALMRNEFVAESQDKIHREIVAMGISKLKRIDTTNPFASFYQPREEVRNPTYEAVDLNYIKLDTQNALINELKEQLKRKLTVGLQVHASDQVLNDTIDVLRNQTYHNVFYKAFANDTISKKWPRIDKIQGHDKWFFPYDLTGVENWYESNEVAPDSDEVYSLRNEQMKQYNSNADKKPVMVRKKNVVYVLVAWLDDMDHAVKEKEDHFLSVLSKYKYFAEEEEEKKILVGHAWTGEVVAKDAQGNTFNKKWCDPSISKAITVKGSNTYCKTFREKNVVDVATHKIHGREKQNVQSSAEKVDIHYDDYAMKVRLTQLDEFDPEEYKSVDESVIKSWMKNRYGAYSKKTLKDELNLSQSPIFDDSFPLSYVQSKFDDETANPS